MVRNHRCIHLTAVVLIASLFGACSNSEEINADAQQPSTAAATPVVSEASEDDADTSQTMATQTSSVLNSFLFSDDAAGTIQTGNVRIDGTLIDHMEKVADAELFDVSALQESSATITIVDIEVGSVEPLRISPTANPESLARDRPVIVVIALPSEGFEYRGILSKEDGLPFREFAEQLTEPVDFQGNQ